MTVKRLDEKIVWGGLICCFQGGWWWVFTLNSVYLDFPIAQWVFPGSSNHKRSSFTTNFSVPVTTNIPESRSMLEISTVTLVEGIVESQLCTKRHFRSLKVTNSPPRVCYLSNKVSCATRCRTPAWVFTYEPKTIRYLIWIIAKEATSTTSKIGLYCIWNMALKVGLAVSDHCARTRNRDGL